MTPAELAEKLESFASEQDEKADVETNRAMRVGFGNEAKLLRQAAARLRSMAEALRLAERTQTATIECFLSRGDREVAAEHIRLRSHIQAALSGEKQ